MLSIVKHISKGNKKLPKSTWIFNAGSATDCPSKLLGLCQCSEKCYAMKAEIQYPAALPYRRRQAQIWKETSSSDFAAVIISANKRARIKCNAFRYNEAGDFESQKQVQWFAEVCRILSAEGISCYGYTARTDLDLLPLMSVAAVNVSNDEGNWLAKGCNRFKAVTVASRGLLCAGDCRRCSMCQKNRGKTIQVLIH